MRPRLAGATLALLLGGCEQRVFERCMRGRGYELVRTDKPR